MFFFIVVKISVKGKTRKHEYTCTFIISLHHSMAGCVLRLKPEAIVNPSEKRCIIQNWRINKNLFPLSDAPVQTQIST